MISSIDIAKIASYVLNIHKKLYASINRDWFRCEVTLSEAATIFSEVTGKSTVMRRRIC